VGHLDIAGDPAMYLSAQLEQLSKEELATLVALLSKVQSQRSEPIPQRRLYSVRETCQLCNMSPASFWRRVQEFKIRKIGRRTFITAESVERFLHSLPNVG
jgi:hypothetical protein